MAVKILQWNAASLPARRAELVHALAGMVKKPDVICIQETWLSAARSFSIEGYSCERHDRSTGQARGGVATLVREGVSYSVLGRTDVPESITISLVTVSGDLSVVNVYHPPLLPADGDTYPHLFRHNRAIVIGDFNAVSTLFGGRETRPRGRLLEEAMDTQSYVALNMGVGTHLKRDGSRSHLDLAMASRSLARKCDWSIFDDTWGSDHFPIVVTIDEGIMAEEAHQPRWLYNRADWGAFKAGCQANVTPDLIGADPETSHREFVKNLLVVAGDCVPKSKPSRRPRDVPYWNNSCSEAVKNRNKAKTRMQRTRDTADASEYRRLKGLAQKTIRDAQRTHWREYCASLSDRTKLGQVWKTVRRMSGVKSRQAIPTLKTHDNDLCRDNQSKAELFAQSFAEVSSNRNLSPEFQARKAEFEREHGTDIHREKGSLDGDGDPVNEEFSLHSLRAAILRCKKNSSPGEDGITYEILAKLPKNTLVALLKLYNLIWSTRTLPSTWKSSLILPILKPNKPAHETGSYRPIALTSVLCKVMERLVTDRLVWLLESSAKFNKFQSGFRKLRSCQDQIVRLQDDIHRALSRSRKGSALGVFIDLEKAFDLMWVDGLLHKLHNLGINGRMYDWIRDFLTDRTIRVRVGSSSSEVHRLDNGSPQGSVISPILFIILLNDIPDPTNGVQLSLYADDSAIWRAGSDPLVNHRELQRYLDKVKRFLDDWGFKISSSKTVAVSFHRKSADEYGRYPLAMGKSRLEYLSKVKFLGVIFDRRLRWTDHVAYIVDRCKPRLNLLRAISGSNWGASKETLLVVYRALIRSVLDYGCIAFDSAPKTAKAKLDTVQSRALAICTGAMRGTAVSSLQSDCGEMPLSLRRRQMTMEYTTKIRAIPDHPTRSILRPTGRIRRPVEGEELLVTKVGRVDAVLGPMNLAQIEVAPRPPWRSKPPEVDVGLLDSISDRSISDRRTDLHIRQVIEDHIRQYEGMQRIYTDGSCTPDGRASCSFYVPSLDYHEAHRLTDGTSIYAAEMMAILKALEWVVRTQETRAAIFSDCLAVLQSSMQQRSQRRPMLLQRLLAVYEDDRTRHPTTPTVLVWIPGHSGIYGNETADKLCRRRLRNSYVDLELAVEHRDMQERYRAHFVREWQKMWAAAPTGSHYRDIESAVGPTVKYADRSRRKEVCITRLRFGQCRLNAGLHKIGCHPDGLCESCHVSETVYHYLLECPAQRALQARLEIDCSSMNLDLSLRTVLSNRRCIDSIYDSVEESRRCL